MKHLLASGFHAAFLVGKFAILATQGASLTILVFVSLLFLVALSFYGLIGHLRAFFVDLFSPPDLATFSREASECIERERKEAMTSLSIPHGI